MRKRTFVVFVCLVMVGSCSRDKSDSSTSPEAQNPATGASKAENKSALSVTEKAPAMVDRLSSAEEQDLDDDEDGDWGGEKGEGEEEPDEASAAPPAEPAAAAPMPAAQPVVVAAPTPTTVTSEPAKLVLGKTGYKPGKGALAAGDATIPGGTFQLELKRDESGRKAPRKPKAKPKRRGRTMSWKDAKPAEDTAKQEHWATPTDKPKEAPMKLAEREKVMDPNVAANGPRPGVGGRASNGKFRWEARNGDDGIGLDQDKGRDELNNAKNQSESYGGKKSGSAQRGAQLHRQQGLEQDLRTGYRQNAEKPESFIPDKCYFENTYLGGNAAYVEQLRRLDAELGVLGQPHRLASAYTQAFDAPPKSGMSVSASLNTRWFQQTGRVYLQVGLQGSQRYGWRRPPLELVLVIDGQTMAGNGASTVALIRALLRRLGPQDTLGIVLAGDLPRELASLSRIRGLRNELLPRLHKLSPGTMGSASSLAAAMSHAGAMLRRAAETRTTLPGTQVVLTLTSGAEQSRVSLTRNAAHKLTVRGVVTSVIELGDTGQGAWWSVANAGHGNYHRVAGDNVASAVDAELESLSRVVSRLLRLNVRLAPGVKAIRVLGSRVLDQQTVREVKAREEATDRNLSKSLGIESDRGEDDDGIQTVIPYFYGGDSHVVVIELWVEKPGPIADVTLKYKDMVTLKNATARTAANLRNVPRHATGQQFAVARNIRGFHLAESLKSAADALDRGDANAALSILGRARTALSANETADAQLLNEFTRLVGNARYDARNRAIISQALRMAGRRKIGGSGA